MTIDQLRERFLNPSADDRMMPFWFWNDDLDAEQIATYLDDLREHGVGGFVIHARQGLPRSIGYLTERWFELVKAACDAAAVRGMKVILYDEGCYPSGGSHGLVTRGRPDLCARVLVRQVVELEGPCRTFRRARIGENIDHKVVGAVLVPLAADGTPRYDQTTIVEPDELGLVRLELGPGKWRLEAYHSILTGGTLRGVFAGEDDAEADAPPAPDLLNPEATQRFIETTHEAYYGAVSEHFGETVIAVFVDEPSLTGRGPRRQGVTWTGDLLQLLGARLATDALPLLAGLYDAEHPQAEVIREAHEQAVAARLNEAFYGPLAQWCEAHGVALVGHPEWSDDLEGLERYQWPGQDIVWRYVVPGDDSGLQGRHSTAARTATSVKRARGRERAATECLGAYGWDLTADEMKWVIDWHLARGNDLFIPHAFYTTIEGRAGDERPPCLGPHNLWWPWFRPLADYLARVCAILRVGEPVVETAVACNPRKVPWSAAKVLQQHQIDFDYVGVDDAELLARYAEIVPDGVELAGGIAAAQASCRVLEPVEPLPDLRCWRVKVGELHVLCLINEGEQALVGDVTVRPGGRMEAWDPLTGEMAPLGGEPVDDGARVRLELPRRAGVLWVIDPSGEVGPPPPSVSWVEAGELDGWSWVLPGAAAQPCRLVDWTTVRELETFSGTIDYAMNFTVVHPGDYRADLGQVCELAAVALDGQARGACLWAPYGVALGRLESGRDYTLTVTVANSMANCRWGSLRPSGLLGPVRLQRAVD